MDKLRNRMILIGLIPMLGLVWSTVFAFIEQRTLVEKMESVLPLSELAVTSSTLIHELQKERGAQVGLISSKGAEEFRAKVNGQRLLTDSALNEFETFTSGFDASDYSKSLSIYLYDIKNLLGKISNHREDVDKLSVTVPKNVEYYTDIIYSLMDVLGIIQEESPEKSITRKLLAYRSLIWAKESAGLERAIGAALFSKGTFVPSLWARYVTFVKKQDAYLRDFHVHTTPEEGTLFAETVQGEDVSQVETWRAVLLDLSDSNDTQGIDAATWFAHATGRINKMKQVEDAFADQILALAKTRLTDLESDAYIILAIYGAVLAAAVGIGGWLLKSTAGPLNLVTEELLAVADGRERVVLPRKLGGGQEMAALAAAARTFLNERMERERLADEAAEMRAKEEKRRKAAIQGMADTVERENQSAITEIRATSDTLQDVSNEVTSSAVGISGDAEEVKTAADNSLRNTQTVAAASEQLSASIAEIMRQVEQQREIASRAASEADRSSKTVQELDEAAKSIGEVVTLIQDIAEQTNLLALNATIEAARAGDAGKGFAVVASEVKNLANQTARATEGISQQVSTMAGVTRESTEAIRSIVQVITEMGEISQTVTEAMEQQSAATQEIAGNVAQSTQMSREVADRIARVSDAAEAFQDLASRLNATSSEVVASMEAMQQRITKAVNEAARAT